MEFEEIFSIFILDIVHIDASFEFFEVFQFLTGEELSRNGIISMDRRSLQSRANFHSITKEIV